MTFLPPFAVNSKRRQQEILKVAAKEERDLNSGDDLFCLKCIKKGKYVTASGFCKVCGDFLCEKCVDAHESTLMTLHHGIVTGSEMLDRYLHAQRKDSKTPKQKSDPLSMIADGKATLNYTEVNRTNSTTQVSARDKVKDPDSITDTKVKLVTDMQMCFICACIVLADGTVILADANNKNIKLFDKFFNWLSVFQMKKEPWDMCGSMDRGLLFYVTESQVQGVHQFRAGNDIEYILTLKTDGNCFGVAAWGNGVVVSVKKNKKFQIQFMDKYGNIHHLIRDGPQMLLRTPWYLTSLRRKPLIIVSDSEARSITGLNYEGNVEFVFKNKTDICDPRNVTADDDGNIYVIDYELDTVHQLSHDGQDRGVILCRTNGLRSPCGLACNGHMLYLQIKMDSTSMQVFLLK